MIFGESRVPFERPVQATAGFIPRSLDTGFVAPENNPLPQIMAARLLRAPAGVHQPISAEPGVIPGTSSQPVTVTATQPPSGAAIKRRSAMRLPIPLLIRMGMMPMPRTGIRSGLDPSRLVKAGRTPGL
jgi:hypothetical protein